VLSGVAGLLVTGLIGFCGAWRARKIGAWEVLLAGLIFTAVTSWRLGLLFMDPWGMFRPGLSDLVYLASMLGNTPMGGIVLAALAIWGVSFLGSSLGFLLAGSGRLDLRFSYEAFVARSHLQLRKKTPTRVMTIISVLGVTVGVLALTVVLSVMSGFELDLKQKIVGTNAHAVVLKYGTDFKEWQQIAPQVSGVFGVTGVTPFILNEVIVSSDQNNSGALIKGIEPQTVAQVSNLSITMKEGRVKWLEEPEKIPRKQDTRIQPVPDAPLTISRPSSSESGSEEALSEEEIIGSSSDKSKIEALPGILLGKELAHSLKVSIGDRVHVVSPLGGELGPTGPVPKSRSFLVAGIVFTGMYEFDAKFAYIHLHEAQKFFGLGESVTGLEVKTNDIDNTRQITKNILRSLDGYPYRTRDWGEMNKNLFSALRLEKLVMAVILAFIVLVACFNILATLIMKVLEKSKEIAILKSMGSTDTSIMKIFVLEGLIIGAIGTFLGLALGYITCMFVQVVGIQLDAEVYYIDQLPVRVEPLQFAVVALVAILMSYLATIFPATRASRVAPVDGLRNE
jgi:lipoprotein-releasing system permease protein